MKHCDFCGGQFGLISYRHFRKLFCRKRCKENYFAARAQKIEARTQIIESNRRRLVRLWHP